MKARARLVTAFGFILGCALCLAACDHSSPPASPAKSETQAVQRSNPASENCATKGGRHSVETNPTGGQFSVCLFEDNRQCEEWALLRGECPQGGVKVTGFVTAAARYCVITGGKYTVTANNGASDERGDCVLPGKRICDADAYFAQGSACPAKS